MNAEERNLRGTVEEVHLMERLSAILPDKYKNIRLYEHGGTRVCFIAEWGPGNEKRIIKIDKTPETPRGKRHTERGYVTAHDISVLARIEDPEQHHITRFCDYYEVPDEGITISVETHFESESLEKIVNEKPLDIKEFETVFSHVLEAERYLIQVCGLFHRDLKPSNILVKRNGSIDTRVTDLANAGDIEKMDPSFQPTAGGNAVRDPFITPALTGDKEACYNIQSELYEIGTNMLFALTGKYHFEYDDEKGIGRSDFLDGSILDENGKIIWKKYEEALENTLNAVPKKARKYASLIRNCLTSNEKGRYKSFAEIQKDFEKIKNRQGFASRLAKPLPIAAAALTAALSIGGTVAYFMDWIPGLSRSAAEKMEKTPYVVDSGTEKTMLETSSNFIKLGISMSCDVPGERYTTFMYKDAIVEKPARAMPGSRIWLALKANELPKPKGYYRGSGGYKGRAYIEGFKPVDFSITANAHNFDSSDLPRSIHIGSEDAFIQIPEDAKPGVYTVVAEIYAPEGAIDGNMKFQNPGKVIARKRMPIIIGDVSTPFLKILSITYTGHAYVENLSARKSHLSDEMPEVDNLTYEVRIPEEGFSAMLSSRFEPDKSGYHSTFSLPEGTSCEERTLQLIVRNEEGIAGMFFAPIKRAVVGGEASHLWEHALSEPDFAERIMKYRQETCK